mgnify:CR=1 FL=1
MMKFFQKLGKSLMLPVACLPVCGILMGIGYILAPAAMAGEVQGFTAGGLSYSIGLFLIKSRGYIDRQHVMAVCSRCSRRYGTG